MLDVVNRSPLPGREGRVKITLDDGSVIEGTLAMDDDALDPGTPWDHNSGRLLQADIRRYAVGSGVTVSAGDVVDVSDGLVKKSYDSEGEDISSQAIALQDGTEGTYVEVIFSGAVYADWVTAGLEIVSWGARGYGSEDGLLSVYPHWFGGRSVVKGAGVTPANTGSDNAVHVDLGFRPALIAVRGYAYDVWDFSADKLDISLGGGSSSYSSIFTITDTGFRVVTPSSNGTSKTYSYLAFR